MQRKIFVIVLSLSLVGLQSTVLSLNEHKLTDYDPLVDLEVTIDILRIRSLEKDDSHVNAKEEIDKNSDPDFYLKVFVNNEEFTSDIWHNTKYIYNPEWSATANVADDQELVDITIQLWDAKDENFNEDRLCDISGDTGSLPDNYDVEIQYNIKTGHWTGDDFLQSDSTMMDPSGYGRLNGCDDGSIYIQERDCELWFSISQNDYDNDGIPYFTEIEIYQTDPTISDIGVDEDGDGIPFEWEHHWGYNPKAEDKHTQLDPEDDGLDNYEEYLMAEWYADPYRDDVFVELDQMEASPSGEESIFPEGAKELLFTVFNRNNVVYHLDDGDMGGSESIPFNELCEWQDVRGYYQDYFLHGDEDNWRKGIFHYGVLIYDADGAPGYAFGRDAYQISSKEMENYAKNSWLDRDVVYASGYMHEIGHNFNFWPIPGHNHQSVYPWQVGYWLNRLYISCMNYGYIYQMVDYSNGSRFFRDYNDWERMDISGFQQ